MKTNLSKYQSFHESIQNYRIIATVTCLLLLHLVFSETAPTALYLAAPAFLPLLEIVKIVGTRGHSPPLAPAGHALLELIPVEMITEENLDSDSREVHYVSENGRVEGLILESRQAFDSVQQHQSSSW